MERVEIDGWRSSIGNYGNSTNEPLSVEFLMYWTSGLYCSKALLGPVIIPGGFLGGVLIHGICFALSALKEH